LSQSGKQLKSLDLSWRGEYIFYLFSDSKNRKWICQAPTEKPIIGVACLLPDNRVKEYGTRHGLTNRILVVKESPNQKIYAAGIGINSYLYRYLPEEDEFLNLSLAFDFPVGQNFEVHDFTIDLKGLIWLATTDGLLQYDMERIRRIDLGSNYQDMEIRAITSLPDGSIWISTDTKGLMRLQDDEVVIIGEEAGLPAKIMAYRTLIADNEHRLWAGTVEGAVYSLQALPIPVKTSTPLLLSASVEDKQLAMDQLEMTLKQAMKLRYLSPAVYGHELFYQHKIDDGAWGEQTRNREIEVNNLDEGMHSIDIRARKNGGFTWSDPLEIEIEVMPPWYRRNILLTSLIIIGAVILILLLRWARKRYNGRLRLLHEELESKREAAFRQESDIVKMQENLDQVRAESRANILTLELLMRIISVITPGMKWDLVMENLTLYLLKTPGVVAFEIARKKGEKLEIEGFSELTRSFISARVPYDAEDCLACYCQVNNKPVHIANIAREYKDYLLERDSRIEVYKSAIGVPLYLEHSQKASLFLFSNEEDYFDTSSLKALGVVAAYIEQIV
jgi:hypothetical protein